MMMDRVCEKCGALFQGGQNAFFCPKCRKEKSKIYKSEYYQNHRSGNNYYGSKRICVRCGREYTVNHENKQICFKCVQANAKPIKCAWCGNEFSPDGRNKTCSKECRIALRKNYQKEYQRINYHIKAGNKKCKSPDCNNYFKQSLRGTQEYCSDRCRYRDAGRRKREARTKQGVCPQCGQPWVDPEETHRGKPKYCARCQKYFEEHYKAKKSPPAE
jgi:hypothetical protein